jgi:hypothetical protein
MFDEITRADYWRAAYKRLRLLQNEGLIYAKSVAGFRLLYDLSKHGHGVLRWGGRAEFLRPRGDIPLLFLKHELRANSVALALSSLRGLEVWTAREWLARTRFDMRRASDGGRWVLPDLRVQNAGRPVAIEVELEQKSRKRYWRIWNAYAARWPKDGVVLYLVDWPSGMESLIELAREWGAGFIWVSDFREFRLCQARPAFIRRRPSGNYDMLHLDPIPSRESRPGAGASQELAYDA